MGRWFESCQELNQLQCRASITAVRGFLCILDCRPRAKTCLTIAIRTPPHCLEDLVLQLRLH